MNVILLVLVLCSIIFETSAKGNQYEVYFSQFSLKVATHDNWERLCYQFTNPSIKAAAFLTML